MGWCLVDSEEDQWHSLCPFYRKNKKKKNKKNGHESNSSTDPTRDKEPVTSGPLCQEKGLDAEIAFCDVICIYVKDSMLTTTHPPLLNTFVRKACTPRGIIW